MIRQIVVGAVLFSSVVLAQSAQRVERAPAFDVSARLACPAGTTQAGSPRTGRMSCGRIGDDGQRVLHGPMVVFRRDGTVEAMGNEVDGRRSGKWVFFDASGARESEVEFKAGDYHGRRAFYGADGQLKGEELWVDGKRQGPQKSWNEAGQLTVVNFRDDKPTQN